jgi:hypothetical protein
MSRGTGERSASIEARKIAPVAMGSRILCAIGRTISPPLDEDSAVMLPPIEPTKLPLRAPEVLCGAGIAPVARLRGQRRRPCASHRELRPCRVKCLKRKV